jgi:hypothetical protein
VYVNQRLVDSMAQGQLVVIHSINISLSFMDPEGPSLCSQKRNIGSCSELLVVCQSSSHLHKPVPGRHISVGYYPYHLLLG